MSCLTLTGSTTPPSGTSHRQWCWQVLHSSSAATWPQNLGSRPRCWRASPPSFSSGCSCGWCRASSATTRAPGCPRTPSARPRSGSGRASARASQPPTRTRRTRSSTDAQLPGGGAARCRFDDGSSGRPGLLVPQTVRDSRGCAALGPNHPDVCATGRDCVAGAVRLWGVWLCGGGSGFGTQTVECEHVQQQQRQQKEERCGEEEGREGVRCE
mmetsp:Transcript_7536/g.18685  ORF Transcript_7536/g.18685 Transcript_7536/m.18685 type:complete len:213 (+) Transcript_7536:378-1016(+)